VAELAKIFKEADQEPIQENRFVQQDLGQLEELCAGLEAEIKKEKTKTTIINYRKSNNLFAKETKVVDPEEKSLDSKFAVFSAQNE
jgi:hypothetical protein